MHRIRFTVAKGAIDPGRNLVKIIDRHTWKPVCQQEEWQPGTEIRCDGVGCSLFRTGTKEAPHYHDGTWELYLVLEGSLRIAVKPHQTAKWEVRVVGQHDILLLPPGTVHVVDSKSDHVTMVFQAPPAVKADKREITDFDDIRAATMALEAARESSAQPSGALESHESQVKE